MKKQLINFALPILFFSSGNLSYAQDFVQKKITNENGNISLVTFKEDSNFSSSSVKNIFNEVLKLSKDNELRLYNSEIDDTHQLRVEKYQQYYKGIFVEFSGYNVQFKNGKIISMSGGIFQADGANTYPGISASIAFDAAVKNVNAQKYMWEDSEYLSQSDYKKPKGDLVLLPIQLADGTDQLTLAYRFDIYAQEPISREFVYVDAMSGNVIMSNPIMMHSTRADAYYQRMIEEKMKQPSVASKPVQQNFVLVTGTADTRYSGTQQIETSLSGSNYILYDTTRGNGVRTYNLKNKTTYSTAVEFTDNDNNWTSAEFNNAAFDNAALDAHWGVEKTYDYFKAKFNRNSYNNTGGILKSYVHYSSGYDNAGWTGSEMIYGDGASYFKPLTAFDVTAHELGHGVCSTSAALAYQRESGAMNEGFSDIWGAAAEYAYAPTKQTWLIGEDITKVNPGYLRSLSNPKSGLTAQPDTYHGINWYPATVAEGCATPNSNTNDNCGVHTNSGVLNHWFYILSMGKSGTNDLGKTYNVTGITIEKAEQIAYKLETFYLSANSTYMDARNFGIQAATTLYGANSPEMIATQDAFYAVGLGGKWLAIPDTTAPTVPTNLIAYNTTGTTTTLQWDPSTDNTGVDAYLISKDGVQLVSVPGNTTTYIVKNLTRNTSYTFKVKAKDEYENISADSNPVTVTTLDIPTYCTSQGTTQYEKIKRVVFNTIDNTSTSSNGYEDFSYITTDVNKGSTYTISITPEWTNTQYNEGYAVFIDFNNNGLFTDAGEKVFTQAATNTSPVTGSITIPTTVSTNGPVRMRVSLRNNTIPSSCGNYSFGQVEDYTLNLKSALATANVNNVETVIYPNPVKDYIGVQSKKSGEYQYKIFSSDGRAIAEGVSSNKKINTQNLLKGIYIVEIKFQDGEKKTQKFIKE